MKNQLAILIFIFAGIFSSQAQNTKQKIGTNPTLINPSAVLELESTTNGFLPPRMTATQRDAIASPATGLVVWCTNCGTSGQLQTFNGSAWTDVSGSPIITIVTLLNCAGTTHNGTLISGTVASGVSSVLPYTGGNGGTYTAQNIASTGVTGLTATLTAGSLANGAGTLTYIITGTPVSAGTASFAINLGGQSCILTRPVGILDRAYGQTINGQNNHNFVYATVTGADGKTWLNNNLGAHYANQNHANYNPTQQATSATDYLAYGSLFQWGRAADGHELITWTNGIGTPVNGTTATRPESDTAVNELFITVSSGNFDWRGATQNDNLWQGVNGTNNPCPIGFRVPTFTELTTLFATSSITNSTSAANSSLKFTASGTRNSNNGLLLNVGSYGYYWSTTVSGNSSIYRYFFSSDTDTYNDARAYGFSVRCVKE